MKTRKQFCAQFIGENNTLNGVVKELKSNIATVKLDSGDIIDCKPVNVSEVGERTKFPSDQKG